MTHSLRAGSLAARKKPRGYGESVSLHFTYRGSFQAGLVMAAEDES